MQIKCEIKKTGLETQSDFNYFQTHIFLYFHSSIYNIFFLQFSNSFSFQTSFLKV